MLDRHLLDLVNDIDAWNAYPWGCYIWNHTYPHIYNALQKNNRQQRKAKLNYSIKGFVWAFKMWIFEIFPEISTLVKRNGSLPRCISWRGSSRISWEQSIAIWQRRNMEGFIPFNITPTYIEKETQYYLASCGYWGEALAVNSYQMPNVGTSEGARDFNNSPTFNSFASKINYIRDSKIASDEVLQRLNELAEMAKTFLDQNRLEEIVNRILEKNFKNRGRATPGPSVDVNEREERLTPNNEMNFDGNQFPSPSMSVKEVNIPLANRRDRRELKPSAYLQSPFERLTTPTATNRQEKFIIKDYMDLYRSGKNFTTTLTDGGEHGPSFWRDLLHIDGSRGWLGTDHILAWIKALYSYRTTEARWSILPPWFQEIILKYDRCHCYATGDYAPYPSIHTVDELYIPLNLNDQHWVLLQVNFLNWTFTVYDSLQGDFNSEIDVLLNDLDHAIHCWLYMNHFFQVRQMFMHAHRPFQRIVPKNLPRQAPLSGDCGVWVCIFLDRLINKKPLRIQEDTRMTGIEFRKMLAQLCFNNVEATWIVDKKQ